MDPASTSSLRPSEISGPSVPESPSQGIGDTRQIHNLGHARGPSGDDVTVATEIKLAQKTNQAVVPEAALELVRCNTRDYTCQVLCKVVDGQKRVAMLLGESHLKSKMAGEVGEAILANFQHRALEGAKLGQAESTVLKGLHFLVKANSYIAFWNRRLTRGSTIDDSENNGILENVKLGLAAAIFAFARDNSINLHNPSELPDGAEITFSNTKIPIKSVLSGEIKCGNVKIKGDSILELAQQIQDQASLGTVSEFISTRLAASPVNHNLEENYKTGWRERLAIGYIALAVTMPAVNGIATFTHMPFAHQVAAATYALLLPLAGKFVQSILPTRFDERRWYEWLSGPFALLGSRRNSVMAEATNKVFTTDPSVQSMVSVVGKAHVSGVARILKENGWIEVASVRQPKFWQSKLGMPKFFNK